MRPGRFIFPITLLLSLVVSAAGCGDDASPTGSNGDGDSDLTADTAADTGEPDRHHDDISDATPDSQEDIQEDPSVDLGADDGPDEDDRGDRDDGAEDAEQDSDEVRDSETNEDPDSENDPDGETDADDPTDAEVGDAVGPTLPSWSTGPPIDLPGADPLAGGPLEGCSIYQEARCRLDVMYECAAYDVGSEAPEFIAFEDLDYLFRRVLLYERYFELYHSPDGQAAVRRFRNEVLPGTAEAEWGAIAAFADFDDLGEASRRTGTALNAQLLRYATTGSEADYQRMVQTAETLIRLFDVTGIDGYLARHHFLHLPDGRPNWDLNVLDSRGFEEFDHTYQHIAEPGTVAGLPSIYVDGLTVADTFYEGTPMWQGNPYIETYIEPIVSLPAVFGLVDDEELKARIARHLTCYLNRLERIEVRNLQANPTALEALNALFTRGRLDLDGGSYDFSTLDTLVLYAHRQPNSANTGTFDATCPSEPAVEATRVIEADSANFSASALALVDDLQASASERVSGYDHVYAPNLWAHDAVSLMYLAAVAHYMTGEEVFSTFLTDELIGTLDTHLVAETMGATQAPDWCQSWDTQDVSYQPLWALINLLGDSELGTVLQAVMHDQMWTDRMADMGNATFQLMMAGVVPDDIAPTRAEILADAVTMVNQFTGYRGGSVACPTEADCPWLDDPRRTYSTTFAQLVDNLEGGGIDAVSHCPTPDERAWCEDGITLLGTTIPGESITHSCDVEPEVNECRFADGQCAYRIANDPLPLDLRGWGALLWQSDPFAMGRAYFPEGRAQAPGLDLIEAFWLARYYGFIDNGKDLALAWRPVSSCN